MIEPQNPHRNFMLANLPTREFATLQPDLEQISAQPRDILLEAGEPVEYVHFPEVGYVSIISVNGNIRSETGIIGREGFLGASLVLRIDDSPYQLVVQDDLTALRMPRAQFRMALEQCPVLEIRLLRFIHIFTLQNAQTSLANAHYRIEERLARWLCMCHDRAEGDEFAMTQEFLTLMLGAGRSVISDTIHELESRRLIRATTRSTVQVLNRARLEEAAKGAYGIPEAEYERIIAPMRQHIATARNA